MLTTLELPLLIAVIIAGIYLSFKYNPLFGGTHMLKKRAASDPDILGVFVCMYRWRPIKSPLFITKDRIWYELLGTMQFEFAVKDIEEVTYTRYTVRFGLKNGSMYEVWGLIDPMAVSTFTFSVQYPYLFHDQNSLTGFLSILRSLHVKTVDGDNRSVLEG
jgi:hypothetical protein